MTTSQHLTSAGQEALRKTIRGLREDDISPICETYPIFVDSSLFWRRPSPQTSGGQNASENSS